ncbi:MAG: iron-sulfur cluster assembly scaffold protein [Paracoccaceae bacterium]|nr:iron-sulfur cluster assembly scaffold protein [Paracoccaceae bacterium]
MSDSDAALAALYQPRIREHAARVRADRRLATPDVTVTCRSPVCGSMLTLDMVFHEDKLAQIGWKARACTLGMASLGIVARAGISQTESQIADVGRQLSALLQGEAIAFPDPWSELDLFCAARTFPTRFGSITLPFQAIAQGFAEVN